MLNTAVTWSLLFDGLCWWIDRLIFILFSWILDFISTKKTYHLIMAESICYTLINVETDDTTNEVSIRNDIGKYIFAK